MIDYMNFNMGNTRDIVEELFVRLDDIRDNFGAVAKDPTLASDVEQALIRLMKATKFDVDDTLDVVSRRIRLTDKEAKERYGIDRSS